MARSHSVAGDEKAWMTYTLGLRPNPPRVMSRRLQALVPVLTGLLLLPAIPAQKDEKPERPKERDPKIEETADAVMKAFKDRRGREDGKVITLLSELAERAKEPLHKKDERELLKTFSDVLSKGPLRKPEQSDVYFPAIDGLAALTERGGDVLRRIDDRKRFPRKEEWNRVRTKLIEGIASMQDAEAAEYLLELVQREGDLTVLAQAGKSMSEFRGADQKIRKQMVGRLSERLASFELEATAQPVDQQGGLNLNREQAIRAKRLLTVPWTTTMTALTGEKHESGQKWSEWFRDHEDDRWPDRKSG